MAASTFSRLTLFLAYVSVSLWVFSLPFSKAQTSAPPDPVFDTAGQALRRGVSYYIQPAQSNGGGLTLAPGRNSTCPLEIVQSPINGANGLPLRFSPVNNDPIIRTTTDHNIRFVVSSSSSTTQCPQSNVWQLRAEQDSLPPFYVTTGGVERNPGRETLPNWFKIEEYEDAYQIEFCPSVPCQPCRVLCGNIGIFVDDGGRRRLALNQQPFKVVFRRA